MVPGRGRRLVTAQVEDRGLPREPVGRVLLPPRERLLEQDEHPGGAGRVERAALDQRLERALVHDLRATLGEVPDRLERAALVAGRHDRAGGGLPRP